MRFTQTYKTQKLQNTCLVISLTKINNLVLKNETLRSNIKVNFTSFRDII